jgi:hypothetical protein
MFCSVATPSSLMCLAASDFMCFLSSIRNTEPRTPGLRSSRPRNRLSAMSRPGETASDWYTVSMPACRASIGLRKCTSLPSSRICPSSGMSAPHSALIRLVFPAPLSPMTARISPGYSSRSPLAIAVTASR